MLGSPRAPPSERLRCGARSHGLGRGVSCGGAGATVASRLEPRRAERHFRARRGRVFSAPPEDLSLYSALALSTTRQPKIMGPRRSTRRDHISLKRLSLRVGQKNYSVAGRIGSNLSFGGPRLFLFFLDPDGGRGRSGEIISGFCIPGVMGHGAVLVSVGRPDAGGAVLAPAEGPALRARPSGRRSFCWADGAEVAAAGRPYATDAGVAK